MRSFRYSILLGCGFAALLAVTAQAGVSAGEAEKLKTTLMPLGGEKAGNADGSIPAWTGGLVDPGYKLKNGRRDDLFADDKPLFTITAANMNQYKDKLSEGTMALMAKFPDSYKLNVYKTNRTMAATQWVYDNTFKNATRGQIPEGSFVPHGVFGGTPFPIPKTGLEVIWNHLLAWRGEAWKFPGKNILITADGKQVITAKFDEAYWQMPYYYADSSLEKFEAAGQRANQYFIVDSGPPIRAGEAILGHIDLDGNTDQAWVYLTGQRRTRLLPNPCCDTPTPAMAGVMSFDEVYVFNGRPDRFNWSIVGKQEMYVPYNENQFLAPKTDAEVMMPHHLNPDHTRWELHRVWVIEANLAPGNRHVAKRSRYYIDEDSWWALLGERWDNNNQLWKTMYQMPIAMPDVPTQGSQTFGFNDLISGAWFYSGAYQESSQQIPIVPRSPDAQFTPEALASSGIR